MTSSSHAHTLGAGVIAVAVPRVAGLVPVLLFAAFAALYSIYPHNYPHYDELFHVLAGESWAAHGTLDTGDGPYTRTPLYTILVGALFKVFGPGLAPSPGCPRSSPARSGSPPPTCSSGPGPAAARRRSRRWASACARSSPTWPR